LINVHGETWSSVDKAACLTLETARTKLESAGIDNREADRLRGIISAMNTILSLAETKAAPEIVKQVRY
jgi:hypothetical protein